MRAKELALYPVGNGEPLKVSRQGSDKIRSAVETTHFGSKAEPLHQQTTAHEPNVDHSLILYGLGAENLFFNYFTEK